MTANRRSAKRLDVTSQEALQETLDGMVQDLRFTQRQCDALEMGEGEGKYWRDTMVGKIPNEWIRLRNDLRQQVAHLSLSLEAKGIAERGVRVKEAQAVLMAGMVRTAAERAGLTPQQVAALGTELRQLAQETGA